MILAPTRLALALTAFLLCRVVQAAPVPVIVEAVIPQPGVMLDTTATYLEAVKPGMSAQYAGMKRFLEGNGLDLTGALWVVLVQPRPSTPPELVLVFSVTDPERLKAAMAKTPMTLRRLGKRFVAAKQAVLDVVPDAFLDELTARPLPKHVRIRADVAAVWRGYPDLLGGPGSMRIPAAIQAAIREARELIAEIAITPAEMAITVSLTGHAGSATAKLAAAARPSDFRLAGWIPDRSLSLAGHFDPDIVGQLIAASVSPTELANVKDLGNFARMMTGDLAAGISLSDPRHSVFVLGTKDANRAIAEFDRISAKENPAPKWSRGTVKEEGIVADELTFPKGVMLLAPVGNDVLVIVDPTSTDARTTFREVLAARKRSALAPFLAEARAQKEGLVWAFRGDPRALPATMSFTGVGTGIRLRIQLPAAAMSALVTARPARP